jgi:glycosyltransferase involved in cell wall biosynthesis
MVEAYLRLYGKTGILVAMDDEQAMADAISELLADPRSAREMGIQERCHLRANPRLNEWSRNSHHTSEGI